MITASSAARDEPPAAAGETVQATSFPAEPEAAINLPDEVLKKVYYKNALKLLPKLNPNDFPK